MKKLIILIILMNVFYLIFPAKNLPINIKTENKIIEDLSRAIYNKFPADTDILLYDFILINGSLILEKKINKKFQPILKDLQKKHQYIITLIDEINFKELNINNSFVNNFDESELIAFGKYINKDLVILGTITILDNAEKKIWDKNQKKYIFKKVLMLQANVFGTDSNTPLMRFAGYFLLNEE